MLETVVVIGFLWLMLTVILPSAGRALTQNAQDQFFSRRPSASASAR